MEGKTLISAILAKISNMGKWQKRFIVCLIPLIMSIRGRLKLSIKILKYEYSQQLFMSNHFKERQKITLFQYLDEHSSKIKYTKMYFSTDVDLSAWYIVKYYKLRFQQGRLAIEFIYRDANLKGEPSIYRFRALSSTE